MAEETKLPTSAAPRCYFCSKPVTDTDFCNGCGLHVCADCDLTKAEGKHTGHDHRLPSPSQAPDATFTCLYCGSHEYGTETIAGKRVRVCHGRISLNGVSRRCNYTGDESQDGVNGLGPITPAEQDAVRVPVALTVEQRRESIAQLRAAISEIDKGLSGLEPSDEVGATELAEALTEVTRHAVFLRDDMVTARQHAEKAPCTS